jgi:hypothetical protein
MIFLEKRFVPGIRSTRIRKKGERKEREKGISKKKSFFLESNLISFGA